jgi:hypothetical protein
VVPRVCLDAVAKRRNAFIAIIVHKVALRQVSSGLFNFVAIFPSFLVEQTLDQSVTQRSWSFKFSYYF